MNKLVELQRYDFDFFRIVENRENFNSRHPIFMNKQIQLAVFHLNADSKNKIMQRNKWSKLKSTGRVSSKTVLANSQTKSAPQNTQYGTFYLKIFTNN